MGLKSWRRRAEDPPADDGSVVVDGDRSSALAAPDEEELNPFGEEHAWWAERERLQRVFVAAPPVEDEAESPLNEFWSPESLFTYDRRAEVEAPEGDDLADPYVVLGVPAFASWAQVTAAHRQLAKRFHPDLMLHAGERERLDAEEQMRRVNEAYSQLQRLRRNAAR